MWEFYLKDCDKGMLSNASPMRVLSFSNLPPTFIETQEFDCLQDDCNNYASKLQENNVEVSLKQLKETIHGFDMDGSTNLSKQGLLERVNMLKIHFND